MNSIFLFVGGLGGMEVVLIVFAVLLLFGGKKIPELMRGIGKGMREFNTARATLKEELEDGMKEPEKKESSESKQS